MIKFLLLFSISVAVFADPITFDFKVLSASNSFTAELPEELEQYSEQLEELPYTGFKIVMSKKIQLELDENVGISLDNKEEVGLKLSYVKKNKYCFWLNWQDQEGDDILDTKIHLDNGEAFITGSDEGEGARLLVISKSE